MVSGRLRSCADSRAASGDGALKDVEQDGDTVASDIAGTTTVADEATAFMPRTPKPEQYTV
ncbi:hypothetical protein PV461_14600 [Streptomyces scabiei]|nr:hypothetical protein [Streptomyces scabiei]